jgi:hypothetical protein
MAKVKPFPPLDNIGALILTAVFVALLVLQRRFPLRRHHFADESL